ncbi:hypothetical protein GGH96_002233, partial [Coemansia sp. RSA 1972]
MTTFGIWAELKKLYSTQSTSNMVNKIINLFNYHMVPDNLDNRKFLVHFNFLHKKIDLTSLTCDNLINLILLAALNKHFEPVRTKFSKTPAADITESDIFKFGTILAFESITKIEGNICTIGGNGIDMHSRGAAQLDGELIFDDVLHVPQSRLNLLSVSRLAKNNAQVLFDAHGAYVYRDGKPILYAPAVNGLYPVTAASLNDPRL